jgi:hypothetical protein
VGGEESSGGVIKGMRLLGKNSSTYFIVYMRRVVAGSLGSRFAPTIEIKSA